MGRCFSWGKYGWETFDICMGKWKPGNHCFSKSYVSSVNPAYSCCVFLLTCISAYAPPPTVTGMYSIHPIANGTYINGTHFIINFLCKGCILTDGSTFAASDTDGYLGFALSSTFQSQSNSRKHHLTP